jgi:hypothetical protein
VKALLNDPEITVEEVAGRLGVGVSTLYRHLLGARGGVLNPESLVFLARGGETMSDQTCSACGTRVAPHDGVLLSAKEGTRFPCSRCYNETVAEYLGLDYEHVAFDPVTLEDRGGISHTFQFRARVFSD